MVATKTNGKKHEVVAHSYSVVDTLKYVAYARKVYVSSAADPKEAAKELAKCGLFGLGQIAKIVGSSVTSLRRWGIKVNSPLKKLGGEFDPEYLGALVELLKARAQKGQWYGSLLATAAPGFSTTVLSRILGIPASSMNRMVKNAYLDHGEPTNTQREDGGESSSTTAAPKIVERHTEYRLKGRTPVRSYLGEENTIVRVYRQYASTNHTEGVDNTTGCNDGVGVGVSDSGAEDEGSVSD